MSHLALKTDRVASYTHTATQVPHVTHTDKCFAASTQDYRPPHTSKLTYVTNTHTDGNSQSSKISEEPCLSSADGHRYEGRTGQATGRRINQKITKRAYCHYCPATAPLAFLASNTNQRFCETHT